jgi:hypothetical protein
MKTFEIIGDIDILHNGKRYKSGSVIELGKKEAERLSAYLKPVKKTRGSRAHDPDPKTADKEPVADTTDSGSETETTETKIQINNGEK